MSDFAILIVHVFKNYFSVKSRVIIKSALLSYLRYSSYKVLYAMAYDILPPAVYGNICAINCFPSVFKIVFFSSANGPGITFPASKAFP